MATGFEKVIKRKEEKIIKEHGMKDACGDFGSGYRLTNDICKQCELCYPTIYHTACKEYTEKIRKKANSKIKKSRKMIGNIVYSKSMDECKDMTRVQLREYAKERYGLTLTIANGRNWMLYKIGFCLLKKIKKGKLSSEEEACFLHFDDKKVIKKHKEDWKNNKQARKQEEKQMKKDKVEKEEAKKVEKEEAKKVKVKAKAKKDAKKEKAKAKKVKAKAKKSKTKTKAKKSKKVTKSKGKKTSGGTNMREVIRECLKDKKADQHIITKVKKLYMKEKGYDSEDALKKAKRKLRNVKNL